MEEPLLWNTMEEAAKWLSATTERSWTVRRVLDAVARTHKPGEGSIPTAIKVVLPPDRQLGAFEWNTEKGSPQDPFVLKQIVYRDVIPLFNNHLRDLLVIGSTEVSAVSTPSGDIFGDGEYVFVIPIDSPLPVTLDMCGINADDLKKLSRMEIDAEALGVGERASLQKQIAVLAMLLSEKAGKYKNGDKPNASQIAQSVVAMLDELPDVERKGLSSASVRASIKNGIALLFH